MNTARTYTFQSNDEGKSQFLVDISYFLSFRVATHMPCMQKVSSFLRVRRFAYRLPTHSSNFLMMTIQFWICAWIIILMVPFIYVTFQSLQRAMHTSLVNKGALILILQMRNYGLERLIIHSTRSSEAIHQNPGFLTPFSLSFWNIISASSCPRREKQRKMVLSCFAYQRGQFSLFRVRSLSAQIKCRV